MTGGSLGLRTGSYGSLQQQFQTSVLPNQPSPPVTNRKPSKMLGTNSRDKEKFLHTICKFAGRKKVGMMLLCVISAAVFVWVLYVAKGLLLISVLILSGNRCCNVIMIILLLFIYCSYILLIVMLYLIGSTFKVLRDLVK